MCRIFRHGGRVTPHTLSALAGPGGGSALMHMPLQNRGETHGRLSPADPHRA